MGSIHCSQDIIRPLQLVYSVRHQLSASIYYRQINFYNVLKLAQRAQRITRIIVYWLN